ncbi:MAG: hypothetical protein Q7N95_15065 [Alphaproteobacteria bacterium]|nr:hypothetical protein [Alphaproteobacteria bacterium]
MSTSKDYDRALIAPEEVYDDPMGVVTDKRLTPEQKMEILTHWEANAEDLLTASEEGMTGPGQSGLSEVKKAIIKLCEIEKIDRKTVGH